MCDSMKNRRQGEETMKNKILAIILCICYMFLTNIVCEMQPLLGNSFNMSGLGDYFYKAFTIVLSAIGLWVVYKEFRDK